MHRDDIDAHADLEAMAEADRYRAQQIVRAFAFENDHRSLGYSANCYSGGEYGPEVLNAEAHGDGSVAPAPAPEPRGINPLLVGGVFLVSALVGFVLKLT